MSFWSDAGAVCTVPVCTTALITVLGSTYTATDTTIDYTYDDLVYTPQRSGMGNRLTAADYSNGMYYHYEYDSVGNRMQQVSAFLADPVTTAYTYDDANRLTTVGGQTYSFDANGNLTSDGTYTYTYDTANRLVGVATAATAVTYRYNGDGNRLQQSSKEMNTDYTLELNSGLSQVLADGTNTYLYGTNRIGMSNTTGNYLYEYDALGSVRQMENIAGLTLAESYDPYGNVILTSGPAGIYGYTGEEQTSTGLVYLRARYFDPSTSRMLTKDPARAGNNWFSYTGNNPINFIDPTGLDAILINKEVDNVANKLGVEHMGAFFQDENNNWWFFYWGNTVEYVEVDDTSIFDDLDSMNEWLIDNELLNQNHPYRDSVYIRGDFTESHKEALALLKNYNDSLKLWNGMGLSNQDYNLLSSNCGQVTMSLFMQGILPSGASVGDYMKSNGYGSAAIPNWNMLNMQAIFYNNSSNLAGFEDAIQTQRNKYEGKNDFTKWWYSDLISNIDTIT